MHRFAMHSVGRSLLPWDERESSRLESRRITHAILLLKFERFMFS